MKHLTLLIAALAFGATSSIAQEGEKKEEAFPAGKPSAMSTQERFDLLGRIDEKLQELELKKVEVRKEKDELDLQKKLVEEKIAANEKLQKQIAESLERRGKEDLNSIQDMTRVYEAMNPKTAARVFEKMDVDLARTLIQSMDKKKVAMILDKISNERAVLLSEYYSGFTPSEKKRTMDSVQRGSPPETKETGQ